MFRAEDIVVRENPRGTTSADAWSADVAFDRKAFFFDGHFEGFPILPGVAQVGFAESFAREKFGFAVPLASVRKLKFSGVIRPGDVVRVTLERRSPTEVSFAYAKGDAPCSSGLLSF